MGKERTAVLVRSQCSLLGQLGRFIHDLADGFCAVVRRLDRMKGGIGRGGRHNDEFLVLGGHEGV